MISVILACRDEEQDLVQTLSALVPAAVEGLVAEVVVLGEGASEAVRTISDAAGCRFVEAVEPEALVASLRGTWMLVVECGARPQGGWIEEVTDYCSVSERAARFAPARNYRLPLLKRLFRRRPPFELGLLIRRAEALARLQAGSNLQALARVPARGLAAELIPAAVMRAERAAAFRPA